MMTDGQSEPPTSAEDDAALWSLLERAKRPGPVSPYFARRVLREVALEETRPTAGRAAAGWWTRLWQTWHGQARGVFAGALAAVVLLVGGSASLRWHAPGVVPPAASSVANLAANPVESDADPATPAEPPVAAQDVEVIADLDNLLSSEESRLWTDEDNTTARY